VGYYDSTISTPNIDSLAKNGVILNNTYAYNTCTPYEQRDEIYLDFLFGFFVFFLLYLKLSSRASLLTGYFAEKTGLQVKLRFCIIIFFPNFKQHQQSKLRMTFSPLQCLMVCLHHLKRCLNTLKHTTMIHTPLESN